MTVSGLVSAGIGDCTVGGDLRGSDWSGSHGPSGIGWLDGDPVLCFVMSSVKQLIVENTFIL